MKSIAAFVAMAAACMCLAAAQHATVTIESKEKFNPTGFKVLAGKSYELVATGTWTDWYIDCDANGFESTDSLKLFERFRRMPKENWFKLICCVGESDDRCMPIGTHATVTAPANGELFCYANDMSTFYWNNKGSISLDIRAL